LADVFISYARATDDFARTIADALRAQGYSIWFDEELPANRVFADVISEQLDEAKAVVVVWSSAAAASQWVRSEANRAREKGTLVQLCIDSARLPLPFDQIQCLDFSGWDGSPSAKNWHRLVASVDELVSGRRQSLPIASAKRTAGGFIARRPLLYGGAAAAVAGTAFFGWTRWRPEGLPPEAEVLMQKAFATMQDASPEEQGQATLYLQEATRLAPKSAFAWGVLAFSHAINRFHVPVAARAGEETRCRSAARTALELDRNEIFANCSLVMLVPPYRRWAKLEPRNKELANRFKAHPLANSLLADLLGDVGRWSDAIDVQARIDRRRFVIPLSDRSIIQSLWSAGEIQRAEALLAEAVERWPKHPALWNQRIKFLTHSGRADEAVRLLEDSSIHPTGFPEALRLSSLETAKALAGRADAEAAVRANLESLESDSASYLAWLNRKFSMGQMVAERAAALGDADTAFAILEGYYFARGAFAKLAPAAGDEDRMTSNLFEPPMSKLWRDTRFAHLVQEIGLEDYWRDSTSAPDYRKATR
jgi:tetratricopeptide (TPR) repeat protein